MVDFKRPYLFIDVAREILKKNRKFQFVMVGDGSELMQCKQIVYDTGLVEYFEILGFRRDIPNILKLFDALFFPSSGEGFGIVVIEAMAMGVPVFAIDDGAIPETIVHRENGILLDTTEPESIAQQIMDCLEDNELMNTIRRKSILDTRSRFSLDICVKKMQELYTNY